MKKYIYFFSILIINTFLFSCAQIGTPTGGSKDTLPPKIVKSYPANFTENYSKPKFKGYVQFDEYVNLVGLNEKFFISPPTKKIPDIKVINKQVRIKIQDSLKANTTYVLSFGDIICDVNENNPYKNFQYVFSTGKIDTLSIRGSVLNAFNLKKEEKIWVMLYENYTDSTPLKKKPDYVAKTDTSGRFSINFIRAAKYRIFALKDFNANYLYDAGKEKIAYLDTILIPKAEWAVAYDTLKVVKDTAKVKKKKSLKDTLKRDTVIRRDYVKFTPDNVILRLFEEISKNKQRITTFKREERNKLELIFDHSLKNDSISLKPVNFQPSTKNWFFREKSLLSDTITYWITDTLVSKSDTMRVSASYLTQDSAQQFVLKTDTLYMKFAATKQAKKGGGKEGGKEGKREPKKEGKKELKKDTLDSKEPTFSLSNSLSSSQHLNKDLLIYSPRPIQRIDKQFIKFWKEQDSVYKPANYTLYADTLHPKIYHLALKWEDNTNYKLLLDKGAFIDIFGQKSDSLQLNIPTKKLDAYGSMEINFENTKSDNCYMQLVDNQDNVIQEKTLKKGKQTIHFTFVSPANYRLKVYWDRNKNKKWDTGDYLKHQQPEEVWYYEKPFEIKSNWKTQIQWKL